jgi:dTDP-4-amino-4,6-dideoxygalactose transaminase
MKKNNIPAIEGGKPERNKFLIYGSPKITSAEIKEVVKTLKSGWIGTGPRVTKFENLIKDYVGSDYALAVNSATAGLHLSLITSGVKAGDEVITTPMTFASTANVIEHIGAKPVFVDIEIETLNIDPGKIEEKITKKTKAIMPVHMAGRPCDMDKILKIAKKHNLTVIEDAAHALGAEYHGKKIGSIGDLTVFSFYVTKNLITGEGGMVTTNKKNYADEIKIYSLHGMSKDAWKRYSDTTYRHYLIEKPGYKYNMMDLQAAIGLKQFEQFEKNQRIRELNWRKYNKALKNIPAITPSDPEPFTKHAYHLYNLLVDLEKLKVSRDKILAAIHAENIGVAVHFIALHLHPYYKNKYGYERGMFPNAEFVSDRTISIPFSAKLTQNDMNDVFAGVKKVLTYYSKK